MAQTDNVFFCHVENRKFVKSRKGKPKLNEVGLGDMTIFFFAMMLISGLGLLIFSVVFPHYATLARSRAPIEAVISDKRIEKDADLANVYWLDYEYVVDGIVYEGDDMVGRTEYDTYTAGMPIEVIYSPEQPSLSMIEYEPVVVLAFAGITLLFFAIGLGGLILSFFNRRRRRQLIRKGKVIKGTLVDANQSTDEGQVELTINYTFQSPLSGEELHKRETLYITRAGTSGKARIGATVVVLYLNDDLYQLL